MIKLSGTSVTTTQILSGSAVSSSVITDTLFVSRVVIDFTTGALYATIERGNVNGSPPEFVSNYPPVQVTINPDGAFISADGAWKGNLSSSGSDPVTTLLSALAPQFDQFILMTNLITGTAAQ